jgi:hypothetical protein
MYVTICVPGGRGGPMHSAFTVWITIAILKCIAASCSIGTLDKDGLFSSPNATA